MGDGHQVACAGGGTPYVNYRHTDDATPEASPTCGYRWQKVSGRGRDYTVTATTYWSVDWVAGGRSGTEHVVDSMSRQVHVGELQVVIEK